MTSTQAALYLRISRDLKHDDEDEAEQGLGVKRQEVACRELAERLGWPVVGVYADNDTSAYSGKERPAYRRLLADIASGKVSGVISWHTDRLHRSPVELEEYASLCEAKAVPTHTVQAGILDMTSPSGRMVARLLGATARYESEHKSARLKAKHAELRNAGKMVGARSFGWQVDGAGKLTGALDPVESQLLKAAADQILKGGSLYKIAAKMNELGFTTTKGGPWTHGNLKTNLRNPKIAGLRAHEGQVVTDDAGEPVKGQWTPILEVEDWHRLCAILNEKKRTRSGSTKYLLGGIPRCECGGTFYGMTGSDRKGERVFTYSCSGCPAGIAAHLLEPRVLDEMAASILYGPVAEKSDPSTSRGALSERLTALRTSERRLLDLVDAEVFTVSEIAAKRAALAAEVSEVMGELDSLTALDARAEQLTAARADVWATGVTFDNAIEGKRNLRETFAALEPDRQRALIKGSLSILIRRGRSPQRIEVTHLVATSLNDNDEIEWESA